MTDTLAPYADDRSFKIGGATVENGPDCVSIYGSVDFTRDQAGLAAARKLKALVDAVVAALEAERTLPAALPVKTPSKTDNPFS